MGVGVGGHNVTSSPSVLIAEVIVASSLPHRTAWSVQSSCTERLPGFYAC